MQKTLTENGDELTDDQSKSVIEGWQRRYNNKEDFRTVDLK